MQLQALASALWVILAGAQDCPEGSYRSSLIVFGCGGGFGVRNISLAPAATSAPLAIPLGTEGFRVSASSSSGPLSLQLRDEANYVVVAAQDHGLINRTVRAGVYKDVGIVMSSSAESPEDNVSLYLLGALTSPMELSFRNLAENSSMVTLAYTFERVLECTFPPAGCSDYNQEDARWQVEVWSHWASSQYDNSTEAWIAMASPNAEEHGVPWSSWSRVWANFVGNSSAVVGQEWEPGFSYLDTNRNGFVSEDEFAVGFDLSSSKARVHEETVDFVSDATQLVTNQWMAYALAAVCVLLLLLCCFWNRRPKRDGVARSVSQLSRADFKAHKPRAGSALMSSANGSPSGKPKDVLADQILSSGKADFAGANDAGCGRAPLWLFPQIGQGFGMGLAPLRQESFRYSPLTGQEDPASPLGSFSMQAAPCIPSQESFSGAWSQAPQLGSFSLPPGPLNPGMPTSSYGHMGMPLQQDLPPPWQPARPTNMADSFAGFQVQLPRTDAVFHQAMASYPASPAPLQGEAPGAPSGVVQAELSGPVQVESPSIPSEDGWDQLAAAIVPTLKPLRAELPP
ncbi:unnamed protein product [Durusdinium trenchii]|uniref:EF-hand domain-containing protein n=2 Tax=Durusdinium trenchii TaxID=1381693 RepID=A0ABP0QPA2_9DINO